MKLAAIDIGSNAVRLTIAKNNIILKKFRVPLRLGTESFGQNKRFSKETIKYTVEVFKCIASILKNEKVAKYKIYATSAFRNAKNSDLLASKIKDETNLKIKKISGKYEAKVILKSVLSNMNLGVNKRSLLFDLGGGSIELTKMIGDKPTVSKSFELGTVRLLNYIKSVDGDKRLVKQKLKKTQKQILHFLNSESDSIKSIKIIGTGGNFRRLLKIRNSNYTPRSAYFTKKEFLYIKKALKDKSYLDLIKNFELQPDRADVIIPAILIIQMVVDILPVNKIYAPEVGLTDGIISQMVEK